MSAAHPPEQFPYVWAPDGRLHFLLLAILAVLVVWAWAALRKRS